MKDKLFLQKTISNLEKTSGILLIIISIVLTILSGFSINNSLCFVLGISFYTVGKIYLKLNRINQFLVNICILSGFSLAGFLCYQIYTNANDTSTFNEDIAIVLGSGIDGKEPTEMLKERLNKTIEYAEKNPNAIIIVSGGQGPDEEISEAEAMKRYLVKNNISKNRIIKEDKSRNTYENIKNSKEIIQNMNINNDSIVIISSKFHLYRAIKICETNDIKANKIGANILWYTLPGAMLRENISILKFFYIQKTSADKKIAS